MARLFRLARLFAFALVLSTVVPLNIQAARADGELRPSEGAAIEASVAPMSGFQRLADTTIRVDDAFVDSPTGPFAVQTSGGGIFVEGDYLPPLGPVTEGGAYYPMRGDYNGDGKLDVAVSWANPTRSGLAIYLGNGDGTFQTPFTTTVPASERVIWALARDVDGDSKLDIVASTSSTNLYFFKGSGTGSLAAAVTSTAPQAGNGFRLVDINGDGKLDLFGASGTTAWSLLGDGAGSFGSPATYLLPNPVAAFRFGDLNGDGRPDAVVALSGNIANTLGVLLNAGGSLSPIVTQPSDVVQIKDFYLADFDGDNKVDVLGAAWLCPVHEAGCIALLKGVGDGTFAMPVWANQANIDNTGSYVSATEDVVDLNADGKPDGLFTVPNFNDNRNTITTALSDGQGGLTVQVFVGFPGLDVTDFTAIPSLAWTIASGASAGDYTGDGVPDLIVGGYRDRVNTTGGVAIITGKSNAPYRLNAHQLQRAPDIGFGSTVPGARLADVNGDGKLDYVYLNYQSNAIGVRLGDGAGGFGPAIAGVGYIGNEGLGSLQIADLDNDGKLDAAWLGYGGVQGGPLPRNLVAFGNGDGTFALNPVFNAAVGSYHVTTGDFDGDGRHEIAVARAGQIQIWYQPVTRTFALSNTITAPVFNSNITAADMNGDGKLDLVVAVSPALNAAQVAILYGNGNGTFGAPVQVDTTLRPTGGHIDMELRIGDINADGRPDIVSRLQTTIFSYVNLGGGVYDGRQTFVAGRDGASNIALADLDLDGNLDLLFVAANHGLQVHRGSSAGVFRTDRAHRYATGGPYLIETAIGDLNGDNRLDAVVAHYAQGYFHSSILLNDPNRPDLRVASVAGPAGGAIGDSISVSFTISNVGTVRARGRWQDSVWLSRDGRWDTGDTLIGSIQADRDVAKGASYSATINGVVPGVLAGSYSLIVRTDAADDVLEGLESNNDLSKPTSFVVSEPPSVSPGASASMTAGAGRGGFVRVPVLAGQDVIVTVTPAAGALYARFRDFPSTSRYDLAASETASRGNIPATTLALPGRSGGIWYLLIMPASGADTTYQVSVSVPGLTVLSATKSLFNPNRAARLVVSGANFGPGTTLKLVPQVLTTSGLARCPAQTLNYRGPAELTPSRVQRLNSTTLIADFNLPNVGYAVADVAVTSGTTAILAQAVTIIPNTCDPALNEGSSPPDDSQLLRVAISAPAAARAGTEPLATLHYENTADYAITTPLVDVLATNGLMRLPDAPDSVATGLRLLPVNSAGVPGILQPGERGAIPLRIQVGANDVLLSVWTSTNRDGPNGLRALKDSKRPPSIEPAVWDAIYERFLANVGETTSALALRLAQTGARLAPYGVRAHDAGTLLGFELAQAGVFGAVAERWSIGAFGRGMPDNTSIQLFTNPDGSVELRREGTTQLWILRGGQYFPANLRTRDQLVKNGDGTYVITTPGIGQALFDAGGHLTKNVDITGLATTFNYTGGKLTSTTDSNGDTTTFTYTGARVTSITNAIGRVTTLTYDPSGERLIRLSDDSGTTEYSYVTGQGALREHAYASIRESNGVTTTFAYDERGRMTSRTTAGLQPVTYEYDDFGEITTRSGGLAQRTVQMAMMGGNPVQAMQRNGDLPDEIFLFDDLGRRIGTQSANGLTTRVTYDAQDNVTSFTNVAGETWHAQYHPVLNQIIRFTAFGGGVTGYEYDDLGNLIAVTLPDGTTERSTYDARGNRIAAINGRGQTITFSYTNKDQLNRKTYPDGSYVQYNYDGRRRLTSASLVSGGTKTTSFTYDTADRVTRVTDPNGRFVQYSYDSVGKLTQIATNDGASSKYQYDTAGRVTALLDGANTVLVSYAYDAAGRLSQQTRANGTTTAFGYDTAGRQTSITHTGPGGTALESFSYAYDAAGRPASITSPAGVQTLSYDSAGRLLVPGITGYDRNGNRIGPGISANSNDQYSQYGSETFTYDPDGNLSTRSGGGAYVWDVDGRIKQFSNGPDTWIYEYDAMGNRIAVVKNGQRTSYLLDPYGAFGSGVLAEYDHAGSKIADYRYGNGLEARTAGGVTQAYHFDGSGNTALLSDPAGAAVANGRYAVSPFGSVSGGGAPNPFVFGGQYGVMTVGDGMAFMRARQYDAGLGRFLSRDPLGDAAAEANPYQYVGASPVARIDPSGLIGEPILGLPGLGESSWWTKQALGALEEAFEAQSKLPSNRLAEFGKNFKKIVEEAQWQRYKKAMWEYEERMLKKAAQEALERETIKQAEKRAAAELVKQGGKRAGLKALGRVAARFLGPLGVAITVGEVVNVGVNIYYGPVSRWMNDRYLKENRGSRFDELVAQTGHDDLEFWRERARGARVRRVASVDPNDIIGPPGIGPVPEAGFFGGLDRRQDMRYTIRFENKSSASAAAQIVTVTQTLDPNLDWTTVRLADFGFGNTFVPQPNGTNVLGARLALSPTVSVQIDAAMNTTSGVLTWVFRSLDPLTEDDPTDPFAGFLPPNGTSPQGEGFISYWVKAKPGLFSGARINAQARIFFDTNEPIDTPAIYNTIAGTIHLPLAARAYAGGW